MYNWDNFDARTNATWDFCRRFWKLTPEKQQEIMDDHQKAKEMFADKWFYLQEDPDRDPAFVYIPTTTEFRASESWDLPKADNLVVLQLPVAGTQLPPPERLASPIEQVFRCTWFPYTTFQGSRSTGPRKRNKTTKAKSKTKTKSKAQAKPKAKARPKAKGKRPQARKR